MIAGAVYKPSEPALKSPPPCPIPLLLPEMAACLPSVRRRSIEVIRPVAIGRPSAPTSSPSAGSVSPGYIFRLARAASTLAAPDGGFAFSRPTGSGLSVHANGQQLGTDRRTAHATYSCCSLSLVPRSRRGVCCALRASVESVAVSVSRSLSDL